MPDVTKGLQELVSSLDGELTAVASGPKQIVEVFFFFFFFYRQSNMTYITLFMSFNPLAAAF